MTVRLDPTDSSFRKMFRTFKPYRELTPARYDARKSIWTPTPGHAQLSSHQKQLSCITFNVWFGEYFFAERCAEVLRIIEESDSDIVALQEVTPPFLDALLANPCIQQRYFISDSTGRSLNAYGEILLSRFPLKELRFYPLRSAMGRKLLTGNIQLNEYSIAIATVHLESHRISAPVRTKQLANIFPWLEAEKNAILMGDFNFCATTDENSQIPNEYADPWSLLRPNSPGFTEDTAINTMRLLVKNEHKQVRFDRILLKSLRSQWHPISIELLGTTSLDLPTAGVFPSDHFGLRATFRWRPGNTNTQSDALRFDSV